MTMRPLVHALSVLAFLSSPALACQCEMFSTCNEVAATDLVFIGTVESIEPPFLNRWNPAGGSYLKSLNEAYFEAQQHPSAQALARMKDVYLKAFPDAAADRKRQLQAAKTAPAVAALFYSSLGRGMKVRFRVETLFKHEDDDDDGPQKQARKDDSEKEQEQFFEVWTPFGDCGYAFQTGETYLVYASDNEEAADFISTDSCTRTRRLSEAGEDLAYLFFYKQHPEASTRLDGFTTTNQRYRVDFNPLHPETMPSPVAGVILELQSDRLTRYVESDRNGRFLFDGLPEGNYKLSAYGHGYPTDTQLLAGPQPFHVQAKSCSLQVMVLPK